MAAIKPWYKVTTPREDLRSGKPLDASEFAVHLDKVRDKTAHEDYSRPERFFERTYLTRSLTSLAGEVIRRLSGETTETSAIFNMTTQFGGGKTHALTLLYHLAEAGPSANGWPGVSKLLAQAGVSCVPRGRTAVFVGTEFDSISGRGGDDGTPIRKTPWAEIAWQLRGTDGLALVEEHDRQMSAPAGDVIRKILPEDMPCLILMDELMNYVSRYRKSGLATQFYNFLQNLSETIRGRNNAVLAVSIPASELEMNAEDQTDHDRLKKLLDRLGKPVIMSAEAETSEIIRRRLFEWDPRVVTQDGRVLLNQDAVQTCRDYSDWVLDHRQQIPNWFPVDNARDQFEATYPFHPMVLSVFERKWQELPRFQQTRGVLRLLALWVSKAYQEGYQGAHRDALIGLGTAPLDDPLFRAAAFEQLGESRLEGALTTDICGKKDSHAVRLDKEAMESIAKSRLHRKVATTIFFESNGGQLRAEATVPEIRLAVAEPTLDIGNVETVLETLGTTCYYLSVDRNRYRFSLTPNLNKLLSDRRANIKVDRIKERVKSEIQKVFAKGPAVERFYFPVKSNQIPDRAALTLVVLSPDQSMQDEAKTLQLIDSMTREYGTSSRTFKSALIWCAPDSSVTLQDEARRALAWEDIRDEAEAGELRIDETQKKQLGENVRTAGRDLSEAVWRTYKNVILLGKDNGLRVVDLGLVHSSAADSMVGLILNRLQQDGDVEEGISPNFLLRNWPPAFKEWSTRAVRDAFFASPQFPRLLNAEAIKATIARGVANSLIAYVGRGRDGGYDPSYFGTALPVADIEISDSMFIVCKEAYEQFKNAAATTTTADQETEKRQDHTSEDQHRPGGEAEEREEEEQAPETEERTTNPPPAPVTVRWQGHVPPQKWMNFYMKFLSKFGAGADLKLAVSVEVSPQAGVSVHKVDELKLALRELGLDDDVDIG